MFGYLVGLPFRLVGWLIGLAVRWAIMAAVMLLVASVAARCVL